MSRHIKAYSYGCVMAILSESDAEKIMRYSSLIPDEDIFEDGSGEHGRETQPHITVKYGIHTGDGEEVFEVLNGNPPATAKLGKITVFENDEYTVLKIDVESADLRSLNKLVSNGLEVTDSYPDYKPHVTIAYLKKGADWKKYTGRMFDGLEIRFDELLFSSADDVETVIPLTELAMAKVARIANRVANTAWEKYVGKKEVFARTGKKTQFTAKVTLEYDWELDTKHDPEYEAQQEFLESIPTHLGGGVTVNDVRITEGLVNRKGTREN